MCPLNHPLYVPLAHPPPTNPHSPSAPAYYTLVPLCVFTAQPPGFIGSVEDVAEGVMWLSDDTKARFVTGSYVTIDGGITAIGGWANHA